MKKLNLLVLPLMTVSLLASCGPATYTVSLGGINGISIDPTKATQGKDYVATITVDIETSDGILSDTLSKVTVGDKELTSGTDYTYTVHEDRLSADFTIPKENVIGNIVINLNLISFKIDNQDEYETAMKMETISYLQVNGDSGKGQFQSKYSPTVYYRHNIGSYDYERYVEHAADDTYWEYTKENEKWVKKQAPSPLAFETPKQFAVQFDLTDIVVNCPYSTLKYENGFYSVEYEDIYTTVACTLQFLDKKLVFWDTLSSEAHKYFHLSYDEVTPELPTPDPTL